MSLRQIAEQVMTEGWCNQPMRNPAHGATRCIMAPGRHPVRMADDKAVHIDGFGHEEVVL